MLLRHATAFAQTVATPGAQPDRARIERAQQALKDAGHDPGAVDGVMGGRTTAALKAYQKQEGLEPTGRLDDATLTKLGGPEPSASTPSTSSTKASPSRTQTGGDRQPSPADPAQAGKTGANAGEGASYSRSNEKK